MDDLTFAITVGVSVVYVAICLLALFFCWLTNNQNKPSYTKAGDFVLVKVMENSRRKRTEREYVFERIKGRFVLDKETKHKFFKDVIIGDIVALVLICGLGLPVVFVEDAMYALPGIIMAVMSIITISIELELYHYLKCAKVVRKLEKIGDIE